MKDILLSIVIPTYDRADYLQENLEVILGQIEPFRDDVQVVVSDNASPQDVTAMVTELSARYHFDIEFYRQSQNLGMNGNSQFVVSKAKGKYVLLMGDDDLLSSDFLRIMIPYLQSEQKYALIHWNRLSGDANCSSNKLWDMRYHGMIECLDFATFVRRTDDAPNFMSSVIFLRECWNLGKDHVRDTADGYRWFCIVYWGAALLRLPCLYYYLPLVIQRNPARTYISKFPYYIIVEMCDLFQDLDNEIPGLYNFWMQHLRRKWMWTLPGVSEDRSFYRPHEAEFLPHLNQSERRWLKIWLYAPFPTLLRKTYRRFYKRPINC